MARKFDWDWPPLISFVVDFFCGSGTPARLLLPITRGDLVVIIVIVITVAFVVVVVVVYDVVAAAVISGHALPRACSFPFSSDASDAASAGVATHDSASDDWTDCAPDGRQRKRSLDAATAPSRSAQRSATSKCTAAIPVPGSRTAETSLVQFASHSDHVGVVVTVAVVLYFVSRCEFNKPPCHW